MNGVFLTLPCLLPPYRKGVVQNMLQMAFPILLNWQYLNMSPCRPGASKNLTCTQHEFHCSFSGPQGGSEPCRHAYFEYCRHAYSWPGQTWIIFLVQGGCTDWTVFGLFFQEQQEYFSHSSAKANPVYLSALVRGWFAVRQFMNNLLKDLKSCLTAEFILRFT